MVCCSRGNCPPCPFCVCLSNDESSPLCYAVAAWTVGRRGGFQRLRRRGNERGRMVELHMVLLPIVGVFSAVVTNVVPLSAGLIYVPIIRLLDIASPVSTLPFCATIQMVSNGYLGFFNGIMRNPRVFVWNAFPAVVLPCWLGTAVGLTRKYTANEMLLVLHVEDEHESLFAVRLLFAFFSLCMAVFVFRVRHKGIHFFHRGAYLGGSCWDWTKVVVVSFFTGEFL